jgi:hypothetical protein
VDAVELDVADREWAMSPAEFAALVVAWSLQASRLLQATKAAWGIIPPKYQWVPPFALTFVTELSVKLATGVHTWGDVAFPVLIVISPLLPGARSNVHAALDGLATNIANTPAVVELSPAGLKKLTRGSATPSSTAALGATLALLCVAIILGCSSELPPPCDSGTAAAMKVTCALKVQTECVDKGIAEADCQAIKQCDKAAADRTAGCTK